MLTNPLVIVVCCVLTVGSVAGLLSLHGTPKKGTFAFHFLSVYCGALLAAACLVFYYHIDYFKALL